MSNKGTPDSTSTPEVTDSKIVYKGRIFNVAVDTLAFPDGRNMKIEAVRHRGSVVLIPMAAPDRIVLVRQYRHVVGRWLWELPAGSIDEGESADAAAMRECHEEIGKIAGRARRLGTYFPTPGFCDEAMNFFVLTELRDPRPGEDAHQDPDELLSIKEFSVGEIKSLIRAGEIADMKTIVGVGLLSELKIEA
jgi:ADP-ribose pyrophosphatase